MININKIFKKMMIKTVRKKNKKSKKKKKKKIKNNSTNKIINKNGKIKMFLS